MNRLKTIFLRPFYFFVLPIAISCTIIQEGDISSEAQANSLKLTGITITQTAFVGNSTVTILPTIDKTVNLTGLSGPITRYVEMNLPALTGKVKLRSGLNTAAKMYIYYYSDGRPNSFGIFRENLVGGAVHDTTYFEVYRFRYDASLRLNKIQTFINPDPSFSSATSVDTIIYSGGTVISKVTRKAVGDMTVQTNESILSQVNFLTRNISATGCYTCTSKFYSALNYLQSGQGLTPSSNDVNIKSLYTKLQRVTITDLLVNNSGGGNGTHAPDIYYLHPTMLLRQQLQIGDQLFFVYMVDWWIPGGSASSSSITKNDVVDITFNYVK